MTNFVERQEWLVPSHGQVTPSKWDDWLLNPLMAPGIGFSQAARAVQLPLWTLNVAAPYKV